MKKKIFGAVIIAAMALAAGWNFNQSKNEVALSDLALANVEALARDEGGDYWWCCGYWGNCKADNGMYIHGVFRMVPC
ncbi:NVEALA domain-containing protein [uncultured Parabacteroides sp.]|uniref:NVEALA domain-containing protein n=1 Tax=uncultured Parabacteroides sp. TaxID=512312 RepID=UPI002603E72F|nr:NVEALA domain-containing protein [uncultured Parabacteroides sp.]